LKKLSKGNVKTSEKLHIKSKDEIQEMADSANILLDGLKRTADFAQNIGEGKLDTEYKLLSENDMMGHALVEMRDKLHQSSLEIEAKNRELEKLSMVAQKTDNAVIIMDGEGRLEWVNDAFTQIYGYSLEDVRQKFGNKLSEISSHPDIESIIDDCKKNLKTHFFDSVLRSKSGEEIYAQTTITPVADEEGRISKLLTIDSDITSIKHAQEKIEKQRNELELLNATKDKFFSIFAHDLKNPFSALLSLTSSLSDSYNDFEKEELGEYLQRVNKAANRIYLLLENLLTWSRSQTGNMSYKPENTDLSPLINYSLMLHQLDIEKKNIHIEKKLETDLCVFADQNMLMTILRNLFNNALKFTDPNGHISIEARSMNNEFAEICIADNGIGISEEDIDKLFRIDVKSQNIGQSRAKGSGLGLVICKDFVEKHGGKIWVESTLNQGSRFYFSMPLCRTKAR
jgi:PAS domain S-box-containing protein